MSTLEPHDLSSQDVDLPRYFRTGPIKFVLMSICTLGLYEIYWSYKNWRFVKERDGSNVSPFWRACFYPLWHYSLLTELSKSLESGVLSSTSLRVTLATCLLVLHLTVLLPDPYWLASLFTFVAFLPVLRAGPNAESTSTIRVQHAFFRPLNTLAVVVGGPLVVLVVLLSIGYFPSAAVVSGHALWDRDVAYLREANILGPDEEIEYFYSGGLWSIAEDGQFFSQTFVTSYSRDPETGETYLNYAAFQEISDINVSWAESVFDFTVVTIETVDGDSFELWLSKEDGGDRKFVAAMTEIWNKVRNSDQTTGTGPG